jgi:hypothetical protein
MKICPSCGNSGVASWRLICAAVGIAYFSSCASCGYHYAVSKLWQLGVVLIALVSFILSVTFSVVHQGFSPYLIGVLAVALFLIMLVRFAEPVAASPQKIKSPWVFLFFTLSMLVLFSLLQLAR